MSLIAKRTLTRSGIELSEIGLGAATLGFDPTPQGIRDARATLDLALAENVTYIDTAPLYGYGLSERLVGDALRHTENTVISTKVGRLLTPDPSSKVPFPFDITFDYSYDGIMRSFEASQHRLGRASIDILFAHDLGQAFHGENAYRYFKSFFGSGGYRAMEELRSANVVRVIGLGVNETEICLKALQEGDFDLFLLAGRHTLLERTGAKVLFEACEKADIDIIIGGPFNSGMLVGGSTYNYRAIPPEMQARCRTLQNLCQTHGIEIGAAAVQFPLRSPAVKSVIPGPKSPSELNQILSWASAAIPHSFWDALGQL